MYFTGMSIRDISNHYETMGIKVNHMTIYRWIIDYSNMVPIIDSMKMYNNCTRKHMGLKGKTPTESSNIKVEGINKWNTLIQNASLHISE